MEIYLSSDTEEEDNYQSPYEQRDINLGRLDQDYERRNPFQDKYQSQDPQRNNSGPGSFPRPKAQASAPTEVLIGVVTQVKQTFGMVSGNIFFLANTVVSGEQVKLGDKVLVEAKRVVEMPFKFNAIRVQVISQDFPCSSVNYCQPSPASSSRNMAPPPENPCKIPRESRPLNESSFPKVVPNWSFGGRLAGMHNSDNDNPRGQTRGEFTRLFDDQEIGHPPTHLKEEILIQEQSNQNAFPGHSSSANFAPNITPFQSTLNYMMYQEKVQFRDRAPKKKKKPYRHYRPSFNGANVTDQQIGKKRSRNSTDKRFSKKARLQRNEALRMTTNQLKRDSQLWNLEQKVKVKQEIKTETL